MTKKFFFPVSIIVKSVSSQALLIIFITIIIFIVPSSLSIPPLPSTPPNPPPQNSSSTISAAPKSNLQTVQVLRVIDGDTIEIEGNKKIRYIGIDTPETVDPRKPVQCFGREAAIKNKELVEGKEVQLEKDVSETDKYGRLLRYVYVGDIFINDYLVREGFARASSYPPDIKYQDQLQQAENEARQNNRGLWSGCLASVSLLPNPLHPAEPWQSGANPSGCLIKGNISSSGEKIYHLPGQKYYDKTVVDANKGEHWFCTEEEAKSAGWRKSKV